MMFGTMELTVLSASYWFNLVKKRQNGKRTSHIVVGLDSCYCTLEKPWQERGNYHDLSEPNAMCPSQREDLDTLAMSQVFCFFFMDRGTVGFNCQLEMT